MNYVFAWQISGMRFHAQMTILSEQDHFSVQVNSICFVEVARIIVNKMKTTAQNELVIGAFRFELLAPELNRLEYGALWGDRFYVAISFVEFVVEKLNRLFGGSLHILGVLQRVVIVIWYWFRKFLEFVYDKQRHD